MYTFYKPYTVYHNLQLKLSSMMILFTGFGRLNVTTPCSFEAPLSLPLRQEVHKDLEPEGKAPLPALKQSFPASWHVRCRQHWLQLLQLYHVVSGFVDVCSSCGTLGVSPRMKKVIFSQKM